MGFAVAASNLYYKHRIPTGFFRQIPEGGFGMKSPLVPQALNAWARETISNCWELFHAVSARSDRSSRSVVNSSRTEPPLRDGELWTRHRLANSKRDRCSSGMAQPGFPS